MNVVQVEVRENKKKPVSNPDEIEVERGCRVSTSPYTPGTDKTKHLSTVCDT